MDDSRKEFERQQAEIRERNRELRAKISGGSRQCECEPEPPTKPEDSLAPTKRTTLADRIGGLLFTGMSNVFLLFLSAAAMLCGFGLVRRVFFWAVESLP